MVEVQHIIKAENEKESDEGKSHEDRKKKVGNLTKDLENHYILPLTHSYLRAEKELDDNFGVS